MYKLKLAVYNLLGKYYVMQWKRALDRVQNYILLYPEYKRWCKRVRYYERKSLNILEKRQNHILMKAWVN